MEVRERQGCPEKLGKGQGESPCAERLIFPVCLSFHPLGSSVFPPLGAPESREGAPSEDIAWLCQGSLGPHWWQARQMAGPPESFLGAIYRRRSKSGPYPASLYSETPPGPWPGPCLPFTSLPPPPTFCPHTLGLCDLCPSLEKQLLVFPGHKCGSLQLVVSHPGGKCRCVGGWAGPFCGRLASAFHTTPSPDCSSSHRTWRARSLALPLLPSPSTPIRAMWPACP